MERADEGSYIDACPVIRDSGVFKSSLKTYFSPRLSDLLETKVVLCGESFTSVFVFVSLYFSVIIIYVKHVGQPRLFIRCSMDKSGLNLDL